MDSPISLTHENDIATVTFSRPDKRNAIDYQGWIELKRIVDCLAVDDGVRVVIFTGQGEKAFSSGADIKDFAEYRKSSQTAKDYAVAFDGALKAIEEMPKPTISLIKGFCVGGGCELAMATDIRVSAENGRFGIPVARLSILVGYHEMRRLVGLVGPGNAKYLLLSGRLIDSQDALRIGMVNCVVPIEEADRYACALAQEVSMLAPLSHKRHKEILRTVVTNPNIADLTCEEENLPFANFDSEDFLEGQSAFLERRPPKFKGK